MTDKCPRKSHNGPDGKKTCAPNGTPKAKKFRLAAVTLALFAGLVLAAPAQASSAQCTTATVQTQNDAFRATVDVYTVQAGGLTTITKVDYRTRLLRWSADRFTLATSVDGLDYTVRADDGGTSKTKDDVPYHFTLKPGVQFPTPTNWRVSVWDSSGTGNTTAFSSC